METASMSEWLVPDPSPGEVISPSIPDDAVLQPDPPPQDGLTEVVALMVSQEVALALSGVIEALRTDRRFYQRLLGACGALQQSPRSGPLTDLVHAIVGDGAASQAPMMHRLQGIADGM